MEHRSVLSIACLLPAFVLGGLHTSVRMFPRSILAFSVLMVVGVAWSTEPSRGAVVAMYAIMPIPMAVLLTRHKYLWKSGLCYAILMLSLVVLLVSMSEGAAAIVNWYGGYAAGTYRSLNANQFSFQMGFAVIFLLMTHTRHWQQARISPRGNVVAGVFYLVSCAVLFVSIVFTGSRGGTFATVIACMFCRRAGSRIAVLKYLAALVLGIILFDVLFAEQALSARYLAAFSGDTGGRIELWQVALEIMRTSPFSRICVGYGTGGVHSVLGGAFEAAKMSVSGVYRMSAHNTFLDLIMSHGLLGIICGSILLHRLIRTALIQDASSRVRWRFSMLLFVGLIGMSGIVHTAPAWPFIGGWILASLYDPHLRTKSAPGQSIQEGRHVPPVRPRGLEPSPGPSSRGGTYRGRLESRDIAVDCWPVYPVSRTVFAGRGDKMRGRDWFSDAAHCRYRPSNDPAVLSKVNGFVLVSECNVRIFDSCVLR